MAEKWKSLQRAVKKKKGVSRCPFFYEVENNWDYQQSLGCHHLLI